MDLREDITGFVRLQVALGEEPAATIVEHTIEYLEDAADAETITPIAWQVVEQELAAHVAAQASWDAHTDSGRLALAFAALEAHGITARENFTCCQNCGHTEIGDEAGPDARGYTFYHSQDAERAASGGALFLAYGSFGEAESVAVGAEVAAELKRQGLTVDWNGDVGSRIAVPLRWQRRRDGHLAEVPAPGRR